MIGLLVTALLALCANSVTSDEHVISARRCLSAPKPHFGYMETWCIFRSTTPKEKLRLAVSDVLAPFTCTEGNYEIVQMDGKMYVHVKNGCNAIFKVYTEHVEVPNPAEDCEYPWMVRVVNKVIRNTCGGSMLDKRHILTAADCVVDWATNSPFPTSHFVIYSGSSNIHPSNMKLKENAVEKIVAHKGFTYATSHDNIAVITLKNDLKFDRCQRPVGLSNGTRSVQDFKNCRTMGWGLLSNGSEQQNLQWAKQEAVSKSECSRTHRRFATDNVFCASGGYPKIISGDRGDPYVCQHEDGKFYQYGVVSTGKGIMCRNYYTLYGYINAYLDWINDAIHSQP